MRRNTVITEHNAFEVDICHDASPPITPHEKRMVDAEVEIEFDRIMLQVCDCELVSALLVSDWEAMAREAAEYEHRMRTMGVAL